MRRAARLLAVLTVLLAAGTAASAGPATAEPPPEYFVDETKLPFAAIPGLDTDRYWGVHNGAGYRMEVPRNWNKRLVMWAHGFRGSGLELTVDNHPLRAFLAANGYAWAASSYSRNEYDVEVGVKDTYALTQRFNGIVGQPELVYLTGASMGGHVTAAAIEQYPSAYDGAMPICGVLGDHELFDFFLDYNLVAQTLAGVPAYPIPTNYVTTAVPQINTALGIGAITVLAPEPTNDLGRQFRAITVNRSGGPRPGAEAAFAFWKNFLFQLAQPATEPTPDDPPALRPGQIATNLFTRYEPNAPVDVNRTVPRVAPEDLAERLSPFLTQIPKIAGRPGVPVLSLHGLGDLFVPFGMEQDYARDVALHLQGRNLVQRAIRTINHCEFSPTEVGTAWDDLVNWVEHKQKPAGDRVLNSGTVGAPTYGCAFSDRAAYNTPPPGSTRRLFTPCP
jgi:pimeloyl-ACP methyl ester carboxylesterase